MNLKQKSSYLTILILLSLLLLTLTLNNQKIDIFKSDLKQKLESLNLGFSSFGNLLEDGSGDEFTISLKLVTLFKKVPDILNYKFFDKDVEKFEKFYIDIKFKNMQNLMQDRNIALKNNKLSNPLKNKTVLTYNNEKFDAEVRLKGHLKDHWFSKYRMSLKIELKNDKTIFGFSEFSIQKPTSRQYPYDLTFQSMIKDSGNLASNHRFAQIYVNGENWGIMNIEEHVSKELIEKQGRKNSIIVSFSDEKKWLYHEISKKPYLEYKLSNPAFFTQLYNKKSLKDNHNREVFSYISNNRLLNNHIYDTDSFSKAYILSSIWNNGHPLLNINSKYYFNPYTLKLEPITSDQGIWHPLPEEFEANSANIHYKNDFYKKILSNQNYLDNLAKNLQKIEKKILQIDKYLSISQNIFPLDKKKNSNTIKANLVKVISDKDKYIILPIFNSDSDNTSTKADLKTIKLVIPTKTQASEFPQHLHIRHYLNGNIELYNLLPENVTVKALLLDNNPFVENEIIIPSFKFNSKPTVIKTPYKGIYDNRVTIISEYQGFNRALKNGITLATKGIKNPLMLNTANEFDFINQLDDKTYEIANGNWKVENPIIIEGDLNISQDTTLNFSKSSYLIIKGSLKAIGDQEKPIIFKPMSNSWKGIYVLNADKKSYLKNINIIKSASLEDNLLKLTGGITFYKSDVDIENVVIVDSSAEDAINIVESIFSIKKLSIKNAYSDGLDSDFSDGKIHDSEFINIGGDALDFSGSKVSLNRINAINVKDKVVSSGETSMLKIQNSNFENVGVGVVSKDGSSVFMTDNSISNYKLYAAMAYIKKDFYGPPSIIINNSSITNTNKYIRQKGTSMIINNEVIPESNLNVKKLYETEVMSK